MRHPSSVPVLLVLAALAGYATGARPVQAQAEPLPVNVGEHVTVHYDQGSRRPCQVIALRGTFLQCEIAKVPGRRQQPEEWINLATALQLRRTTEK